jgi:hypothetical protein
MIGAYWLFESVSNRKILVRDRKMPGDEEKDVWFSLTKQAEVSNMSLHRRRLFVSIGAISGLPDTTSHISFWLSQPVAAHRFQHDTEALLGL